MRRRWQQQQLEKNFNDSSTKRRKKRNEDRYEDTYLFSFLTMYTRNHRTMRVATVWTRYREATGYTDWTNRNTAWTVLRRNRRVYYITYTTHSLGAINSLHEHRKEASDLIMNIFRLVLFVTRKYLLSAKAFNTNRHFAKNVAMHARANIFSSQAASD